MEYEVTDEELARLADWAEKMEIAAVNESIEWKKAYQALRQGADWILRRRIAKKHKDIAGAGKVHVVVTKQ